MLDKTYKPEDVEARRYRGWEAAGAFACGGRPGARPYAIVIPPPNVTGSLHMGHALNNTLQDILVRYRRMRGQDVLWQPGTDHAGIATQMVVERQLEAEGRTRHDLGREKFIERVWAWKAESGGAITAQLKRLGASCDWSRERFTMDDGLSRAVLKVFVHLYRQGLIYRDKRLVNWDPRLHTAISDLEVEQREVKGRLWHFKYPIEGEPGAFVTVATTRPETMLGDTAVAVHPEDARYRRLVGKACLLPIVGRRLPIVADLHADPEKGTGAVKITPAHDFNDFEVAKRHGLSMVNVLDRDARLNENAPEGYRGLDRFEARERIVADMSALGLLDRVEENYMTLPYGDRSGVVIEPWLTDQWFVDAKTLARPAIEAVERGETRFVPAQWEATYFEWMRNIQPWCVSRQIWWGHQIPAWFGPDGRIFVETTEAEASQAALRHYGRAVALARDPDVLDTWFSSALWPFSTLGWPEETPELRRYYPTDVLVTGFDIIFFWVARMMMMGIHFLGRVPFHTVYIHALVRDEKGQKMSKSKGNVMDPLALIDKYGADALRMTLTALAAQGRDVKLSESRVEGYRNFATKLWNAARFLEMNGCRPEPGFDPAACRGVVNRWIVGKAAAAAEAATEALEAYRFNDAANALYHFTWGTFCDWYLEFIKPVLAGGDERAQAETRAAAAWVMDSLLGLLHPIMPFITEELWQTLGDRRPTPLILSPWPAADLRSADLPSPAEAGFAKAGADLRTAKADGTLADPEAAAEMDWVVRLISEVRAVRAEMNVPPGARIPMLHHGAGAETKARLAAHGELIRTLARVSGIAPAGKGRAGMVQVVQDETTFMLALAEVIDLGAEKARLEREAARLDKDIVRFDAKLASAAFTAKAPPEVVETERERRQEASQARAKLGEALKRLQAAM